MVAVGAKAEPLSERRPPSSSCSLSHSQDNKRAETTEAPKRANATNDANGARDLARAQAAQGQETATRGHCHQSDDSPAANRRHCKSGAPRALQAQQQLSSGRGGGEIVEAREAAAAAATGPAKAAEVAVEAGEWLRAGSLSGQQAICHLTAKTRDNQCALHGGANQMDESAARVMGDEQRRAISERQQRTHQLGRPQQHQEADEEESKQTGNVSPIGVSKVGALSTNGPELSDRPAQDDKATRGQRRRTPKDKAKNVATWPLAKQTLDNNMPEETRLGHFGDCEDLLSPHMAGRLFGGLKCHLLDKWHEHTLHHSADSMISPLDFFAQPDRRRIGPGLLTDYSADLVQLQDELSATNYNHKRLFAFPYEAPPTGWLQNSTGLQSINPSSSRALKGKCQLVAGSPSPPRFPYLPARLWLPQFSPIRKPIKTGLASRVHVGCRQLESPVRRHLSSAQVAPIERAKRSMAKRRTAS